jgi:hypothetical protein
MQVRPFSKSERDELLRRHAAALEEYEELMEDDRDDDADRLMDLAEKLADEYDARLPRLTMSCCPFDGRPLVRTFDPYGLDGLWWDPSATPKELPSCTHFCVMVGAVHYQGLPPRGGTAEVHPGPEVPYVIPRLLELPDMIAVISQVRMDPGYLAYPIAYFAEKRPAVEDLTAGWARTIYNYTTQLGEDAWRPPNDPWDFDLQPWLDKGKIRWCDPAGDNSTLSNDPPSGCPYVNLPGQRERIIVQGDDSWGAGLPDGEPIWPLD